MKNLFKNARLVIATAAMVLAVTQLSQAQRLSINDLIDIRGKSLDNVKTSLEKKGWMFKGQCGGEQDDRRYCFMIGDRGEGLAAVLYLIQDGEEQLVEYAVYRPGLIAQVQQNIKAAALKLVHQNSIGENVSLKIYQKKDNVLVARGGDGKGYYSLEVYKKPAYERMQASR